MQYTKAGETPVNEFALRKRISPISLRKERSHLMVFRLECKRTQKDTSLTSRRLVQQTSPTCTYREAGLPSSGCPQQLEGVISLLPYKQYSTGAQENSPQLFKTISQLCLHERKQRQKTMLVHTSSGNWRTGRAWALHSCKWVWIYNSSFMLIFTEINGISPPLCNEVSSLNRTKLTPSNLSNKHWKHIA